MSLIHPILGRDYFLINPTSPEEESMTITYTVSISEEEECILVLSFFFSCNSNATGKTNDLISRRTTTPPASLAINAALLINCFLVVFQAEVAHWTDAIPFAPSCL